MRRIFYNSMSRDQTTVGQCYLSVLSGFMACNCNTLRALDSHMTSAKYHVLAHSHEQHYVPERDQQHGNPNQSLLHDNCANDRQRSFCAMSITDSKHSTNKTHNVLPHISVQIFGNILNESKFYSGRNQEQIECREFLLSFGAESFVSQFAIQKFKDCMLATSSMHYTTSCKHSLVLLRMDEIIARNMLS